jgi:chorismate dehydratase
MQVKEENEDFYSQNNHKIKIGAVSYLNTKPLIYGFEQGLMKKEISVTIDYPAKIAAALINNTIDIGLIPVAALHQIKDYHIVGNYGIACNGKVASVCLFSDVPINEVKTVLLDYQSKTSVQLVKILLKEYWQVAPQFIDASTDYMQQINGTTAGLVIGDRAFELQNKTYVYDLGEVWKLHTGLPFVFAVWASKKQYSQAFIDKFNAANEYGLERLGDVIAQNPYKHYSLSTYYTQNIVFKIQEDMLPVIELFLKKVNQN